MKDDSTNDEILFADIKNEKKPNIYFFILDAMQPIKEFEKYYEMNLSSFKVPAINVVEEPPATLDE